MKVAIHQPNYLPWIGYFYKIMKADCFVFFDNAQYPKGTACNRNKIKAPRGTLLLTVPVRISKGHLQKINEIEVVMSEKWAKKHWKIIMTNYNRAPFFKFYESTFSEIYNKSNWASLAELNQELILLMLKLFEINTRIIKSSDLPMTGKLSNLSICKALNASCYLSGDGSKNYLIEEEFVKEGMAIEYTNFKHPLKYEQLYGDFIPNLSAIDLLFNHGPKSRGIIEAAQRMTLDYHKKASS